MNTTNNLYTLSNFINSINQMNALNYNYYDPVGMSLHYLQYATAYSSFDMTSFVPINETSFPHLYLTENLLLNQSSILRSFILQSSLSLQPLNWILDEPEEIQEQELDIVTKHSISTLIETIETQFIKLSLEVQDQYRYILNQISSFKKKHLTYKKIHTLAKITDILLSILSLFPNLDKQMINILRSAVQLFSFLVERFGKKDVE